MGRGPQGEPSDPADRDQVHESAVHILGLLAGDKHQPGILRDDSGVLVAVGLEVELKQMQSGDTVMIQIPREIVSLSVRERQLDR